MSLTAFAHHLSLALPIDHLWQSTLVALLAALLVLSLRRHRASLRYWIWFAASMKFLLPFALLVNFGQALRPFKPFASFPIFAFAESLDQIARPFSQFQTNLAIHSQVTNHVRPLLPYVWLALWFCGVVAVAVHWLRKCQRVRGVLRTAVPSPIKTDIPVLCTASTLEPGVFGLFRPVLLLPTGIAERLSASQLRAIIAHEMCHVRRRDNFTSALHMLVECLFWFHPIIWWIGARLVDERERSCDEHVLALGNDPQVYAESILKVSNFYFESPLFCAAGVTGSNLKKRIEAIMIHRTPQNLLIGQKLLLAVAAAAALLLPLGFGVLHAAQSGTTSGTAQTVSTSFYNTPSDNLNSSLSSFESVVITPNKTGEPMAGFSVQGRPMRAVAFRTDRFVATNFPLRGLIRVAYGVEDSRILDGPGWVDSEKYDIEAKLDPAEMQKLATLTLDERNLEYSHLIQGLLVDHFKLVLHHDTKQLLGYALVVAADGPKVQNAKVGDNYPNGITGPGGRPIGGGTLVQPEKSKLVGQGVPLSDLAKELSQYQLNRPVVDMTGLAGNYDFILQWTASADKNIELDTSSILAAIHKQLGLQLKLQNIPTEILVVDSAELPSANRK